jgi:hypothetical protein
MSDDARSADKPGQQDEPADEVEGHVKLSEKAAKPAANDEGNDDEVEAHGKSA